MKILVTGGLGFIGSHFVIEALEAGYEVTIIDNLENSKLKVKEVIEELTGKAISFVRGDIRDTNLLEKLFQSNKFFSVIHFAGYKAVGESTENPLKYYDNNVAGSLNLLQVMNRYNVKNIIFSSSATVYGKPEFNPYTEEHPKNPFNPYGQSKSMIEDVIQDVCLADSNWSGIVLRYFNPIGAHPSGRLGEDPKGIPNNLMPFITKVAIGELPKLGIFGSDYETKDGTGVRDYIHVVDLAKGHLKAVEYQKNKQGYKSFNLGAGEGYSVLEVVEAFEQENSINIPLEFKDRRPGDLDSYWANAMKAKKELNWSTSMSLNQMVKDSWRWQLNNPHGFE